MKFRYLTFSLFLLLNLGCNKDDENLFPESFDISVDSVGYNYASLSWEVLDESSLYDVILSDQEIVSAISQNEFIFENLEANKLYSGRIIATNSNSQRSIAEFEFRTKPLNLNFKVENYIFILDTEGQVALEFSWNQFPQNITEDVNFKFFLNGNQTNISYELINGKYYGYRDYGITEGDDYRFTVKTEFGEQSITEHLNISTPIISNYPEAGFNLTKKYSGYTSFAFMAQDIKLPATYTISSDTYAEPDDSLTTSEPISFEQEELQIDKWPLWVYEDYHNYSFNLMVYEEVNDSIKTTKTVEFIPKSLKRLSDEDLSVFIYNVKDKSFDIEAWGADEYNVFINNDFIGAYSCYWDGFSSERFPTFSGLQPNTDYLVKVEVDYNNFEPNPKYEILSIPLTTFKEFQITTDSVAIVNELDIYVNNITNNSFDLIWKTDLSRLYDCLAIDDYKYEFVLFLNGTQYSSFNINQNPYSVEGLEPNTTYEVILECRVINNMDGTVTDTRVNSTTVTTSN